LYNSTNFRPPGQQRAHSEAVRAACLCPPLRPTNGQDARPAALITEVVWRQPNVGRQAGRKRRHPVRWPRTRPASWGSRYWWLPTSAALTPFVKLTPTLWVLYAPSPLLPISTDSGRSRGVILLASFASTLPLSLCTSAQRSVPCDGAMGAWPGDELRAWGGQQRMPGALRSTLPRAGACQVHQVSQAVTPASCNTCTRQSSRPPA